MIDTIVLRIKNINDYTHSHYHLADYLRNATKYGVVRHTTLININEIMSLPKYFRQDYIKYLDSGKVVMSDHYLKLHIPSSNYLCTYVVNESKDYIEFNFSIPKYLYGQNISQFVYSHYNRDFVLFDYVNPENHKKYLYNYLIKFLERFFFDISKDIPIDKREVEIIRIDLCFNMIFPNKDLALEYLEGVKKISKNYERESSNKFRSGIYNQGISLVTRNWSFKVYHKGTEFTKDDKKKLEQANDDYNAGFDVKYLQSFSDRICRYEITYRKARIGQIWKRDLLAKKLPLRKSEFDWYRMVKSKTKNGWFIGYNENGNVVKNLENAKKIKPKYTKAERKYYKYLHSFMNSQLNFALAKVDDVDKNIKNKFCDLREFKTVKFDKMIFNALFDEFISICNEFIVKKKDSNLTYLEKAIEYNRQLNEFKASYKNLDNAFLSEKEKKQLKQNQIPVNKMKVLFQLLNTHSLSEIKEMKLFPRTTMYRYEQYLKKIGYGKQNVSDLSIPSDFTFHSYYNELVQNGSKLNVVNSIL